MKKRFLQHSSLQKILGISILGVVLIIFLWLFGASFAVHSFTNSILRPVFGLSGSVNNFLGSGSEAKLEQEKKELEVRVAILEAEVRDLKTLLSFGQEGRPVGRTAIVSSQAPTLPYGTLLVSLADTQGIFPGADAIAFGGIYLGEVSEVGDGWAKIKLISFPELETEAWLEKLSLNITLEGQGGFNMKFSVPKSVKIEVGDRIISNTTPQYLIGEVEVARDRPTEPLQEIILRIPLNLRNLRYVELFP